MNKQVKLNPDGSVKSRGIEWTDYTWNPVGGCQHGCRWTMPDGTVAECYAETVAERVAQKAYPHGFEHHYWNEKVVYEPIKLEKPARIFMDSMSDLMGAWVPDEQIERVLDVARQAHWHQFQLLTKNAPRLLKFNIPSNVWVGVSAPPSIMFGKPLSAEQQARLVIRQADVLSKKNNLRWWSIEPLSFDIAPLLQDAPFDWLVIGAASNGNRMYQPKKEWVEHVLELADKRNAPVFFKGNLQWHERREEFPTWR